MLSTFCSDTESAMNKVSVLVNMSLGECSSLGGGKKGSRRRGEIGRMYVSVEGDC